jgi:hypothetical protein
MFEFSDGTDSGWTPSSVVTHKYSVEGEFLASLTVKDEDGLASTNFATQLVRVSSMGFRPSADIITVQPNPARHGELVTLHGKGTPASGANISVHFWNSSIDGPIGDVALVTTTELSQGEHRIVYKVQDDRGLWSDPVTVILEILPAEGVWTIRIDKPKEGAHVPNDYLVVSGSAEYSTGKVVSVEVRYDNGPWEVAQGAEEWSHELDLFDEADGYHTIRVRAEAMDSTSEITFVNFTLGEDPAAEPFDLREWVFTWEGIVVVMILAGIIGVVVNAGVYRYKRKRTEYS